MKAVNERNLAASWGFREVVFRLLSHQAPWFFSQEHLVRKASSGRSPLMRLGCIFAIQVSVQNSLGGPTERGLEPRAAPRRLLAASKNWMIGFFRRYIRHALPAIPGGMHGDMGG